MLLDSTKRSKYLFWAKDILFYQLQKSKHQNYIPTAFYAYEQVTVFTFQQLSSSVNSFRFQIYAWCRRSRWILLLWNRENGKNKKNSFGTIRNVSPSLKSFKWDEREFSTFLEARKQRKQKLEILDEIWGVFSPLHKPLIMTWHKFWQLDSIVT